MQNNNNSSNNQNNNAQAQAHANSNSNGAGGGGAAVVSQARATEFDSVMTLIESGAPPTDGTPFALDEAGLPYYTSPPASLSSGVNLYSALTRHVPYLAYSAVGQNKKGGNVVYVNVNDNGRTPMIQLCDMTETPLRCPFGMQQAKTKEGVLTGDPNRQNLDMTIENEGLLQFLMAMDAKNIKMGTSRIVRWLGPRQKVSAIDGLYKPLVTPPSPPKDGKPAKDYKPTVRAKVVLEGDRATRVYKKVGVRENGEWDIIAVHPSELAKKNQSVIPIVTLTGLWFMAGPFGVGMQCIDVIILPGAGGAAAASFVGAPVRVLTNEQAAMYDNNNNNQQQGYAGQQQQQQNDVSPPHQYPGGDVNVYDSDDPRGYAAATGYEQGDGAAMMP